MLSLSEIDALDDAAFSELEYIRAWEMCGGEDSLDSVTVAANALSGPQRQYARAYMLDWESTTEVPVYLDGQGRGYSSVEHQINVGEKMRALLGLVKLNVLEWQSVADKIHAKRGHGSRSPFRGPVSISIPTTR